MTKNYKNTKISGQNLHHETQMMSYGYDAFKSEGAVKAPVFLTSTFAFESAEDGERLFDVMSGRKEASNLKDSNLIYSRFNNPNSEIIEDRLALLESGDSCSVFSSGMSAISTTFLALLKPQDVIVHSMPIYGGTEGVINKLFKDWQLESEGFLDGLNQEEIENSLQRAKKKGRVGMIFIETPANPNNLLIDFEKVKNATDKFEQENGYRPVIVCDNTLFGPVFQKPLLHGVDLVCYSLTKYIGGHSDLVAGAVIGKKEYMAKVRGTRNAFGSQLDPNSSWMISRSLETLHIRMRRSEESALKIANWLDNNKYCKVKIYHPKYILDKNYQETLKKQTTGYGSTFAFEIEGNRKDSFKFINSLTLFKSAVSLGGTESLICHPASTTHSGISQELRSACGVKEGLIRVSIGLEHPEDLILDLEQGFKAVY